MYTHCSQEESNSRWWDDNEWSDGEKGRKDKGGEGRSDLSKGSESTGILAIPVSTIVGLNNRLVALSGLIYAGLCSYGEKNWCA